MKKELSADLFCGSGAGCIAGRKGKNSLEGVFRLGRVVVFINCLLNKIKLASQQNGCVDICFSLQ